MLQSVDVIKYTDEEYDKYLIFGSPLASSARVVLKGIFVYGPLEVLNCLLLMLELINHSIESHFFFLEEDILLFLCGLMTTQVTLLHP